MPTRKELIEECKVRGLHGYSRKSKQELELLLAPQVLELDQGSTMQPDIVAVPPSEESTQLHSLSTVIPLRIWTQAWVSVCLGIPPYLLSYIKSPPSNR